MSFQSHIACMLVKKCEPIKIEAIVRGYLCGSAYEEYLKFGTVAGHELETGLKKLETTISNLHAII